MANILDELEIIKNIENMYENNSAFNVLKDFERIIDELDLYVYDNWHDGELAEGPNIDRHWVSAKFFWPRDKMPDPMGAKRLLDYDCKVAYQKSYIVKPRKIMEPDDIRIGTKKGKLDRHPIWIVEIRMPKKLMADIFSASLEDMDQIQDQQQMPEQEPAQTTDTTAPGLEAGSPEPEGVTI